MVLLLTGCASTPMTQKECQDLGGYGLVEIKGQDRCCKIRYIDGKHYCEEVSDKEPREPHHGRGDLR